MAPPPHPEEAPRKSSKAVPLAVLGVISLTLVGIWAIADSDDDEVTADCVMVVDSSATPAPDASPTPLPDTSATPFPDDGSYQVVDDAYCDDDNGSGTSRHYYSSGYSRGAYMWYYGGTRSGDRVRGGTTYRPSDVNISSRTGKDIQRGGFGNRWSSGS
ncbi:hypothetical protein [Nonomuraea zeae]|uniref:Uncharacterized protein n=1 Tax=Nonomuraea zeae TaxID=1642303 RepID=A0A5S4FIV4_9ACTN|nr:hypothetical protein [Nonomuraea zeae]TMR19346.1 hypothetical protein ETD85_52905 [Nonomuraea zeae]